MNKSESIQALAAALNELQRELTTAKKKETNPFFKSKYADLAEVWEVCRPLLAKNGLSLAQLPDTHDNIMTLTTILMHTSGEWISGSIVLNPTKSNDPQSLGSAITYGRRYAMSAMLGVATEDDDGEAATGRQFVTRKEVKPLVEDTATEPQPTPAAPQKEPGLSVDDFDKLSSQSTPTTKTTVKLHEGSLDISTDAKYQKTINGLCVKLNWKTANLKVFMATLKGLNGNTDPATLTEAEKIILVNAMSKEGGK